MYVPYVTCLGFKFRHVRRQHAAPDTPMSAVSTPGLKEPVMLCSSCSSGLPLLASAAALLAPCTHYRQHTQAT
jgi:hypothetical protein